MRRAGCALLLAAVAAFAGACGESSAPVATTTLPQGSTVSAKRYLADVAAAAATTRDVARVLGDGGSTATPARLAAIASGLAGPAVEARLLAQRLSAARLADTRLEAQRARAAPSFAAVSAAVDDLLQAAKAGDAPAAAAASTRLSTALDTLRGLAAPPSG